MDDVAAREQRILNAISCLSEAIWNLERPPSIVESFKHEHELIQQAIEGLTKRGQGK